MRKQIRKIASLGFLSAFLVFQGFFLSAQPAQALGFSIPSPSSIASQLEQRYNVDLQSIQEQGQQFNVADNKKTAPQTSIVFTPTDPRPGEKLTARAFPLYFSDAEDQLYYTWYLKREGCDLSNAPSSSTRALCDEDKNGKITTEDWKIAAMGELARNGYSNEGVSYSSDTDNDGYKARFGGNASVNTPNYCYMHDNQSGENYEIADGGNTSFTCPSGKEAACVVSDQYVQSGDSTDTFTVTDNSTCYVSGSPACSSSGGVTCSVGTPKCVDPNTPTDCGSTLSSCNTTVRSDAAPVCKHLFPDAPSFTSGDGSFGGDEEKFWRTDPNDPSTAGNGNKDEANIVGLGQTNFTWNYLSGDKVGVAVEGSSIIPTRHNDSTNMVMWAFSKNDCPLSKADGTGEYTQTIKGFQVTFPTANIDLNDCLEANLVDPTEGGQSTSLDLQMATGPEHPVNDETIDQSGDVVTAQAIVNNGNKSITEQQFEWQVEFSDNPQFNSALGTVTDVTSSLQDLGLISKTKGNALNTLRVSLNIPRDTSVGGRPFGDYLNGDVGYMRVSVRAAENFAANNVRKGRTDAIVQFTSTRNKITAYKADPVLVGDKMRVHIPSSGGVICQDAVLDRAICRVLQNEIIGMRIDGTGLSNFQWTINNEPLACGQNVSPDCANSDSSEVNFFPASGSTGSSYTVAVTATDIQTGKTLTLSRLFQVVDPQIAIASGDQTTTFPKFLGEYIDVRGSASDCPEGLCGNYSNSVLQGYVGTQLKVKPLFIPSFLQNTSQLEWEVNGQKVTPNNDNELTIDASNATVNQIVNVTVRGLTVEPNEVRRALIDTWGISQLDSAEQRFDKSIQIEMVNKEGQQTAFSGIQKYLGAIGTYLPSTVLFAIRMALSGALLVFVIGFLFVLIPEE